MIKFIIQLALFCFVFSCINNNGGSILTEREYLYDDVTVTYIENSTATTFIKDGKPITGVVTQEFRNGFKNIWNVENGLAIKQTAYYSDGQIRRMLEMKNGEEHGTFLMYYSDGQMRVEQFYEKGEPVGIWHQWNRNGELVETIEH